MNKKPAGPAIVGDPPGRPLNPELIIMPDGRAQIVGLQGPEIRHLPAGAKVYPLKDLPKYATGGEATPRPQKAITDVLRGVDSGGMSWDQYQAEAQNLYNQNQGMGDWAMWEQVAQRRYQNTTGNTIPAPPSTPTTAQPPVAPQTGPGQTYGMAPKVAAPSPVPYAAATPMAAPPASPVAPVRDLPSWTNPQENPEWYDPSKGFISGDKSYTKNQIQKLPLLKKLRGNWEGMFADPSQNAKQVLSNRQMGISNIPWILNWNNLQYFEPSELQMAEGLYEDAFGWNWQDVLNMSQAYAPINDRAWGPTRYGR